MTGYLVIGAIVLFLVMLGGRRSPLSLPTWRVGSAMGALFAFAGAGYAMWRNIWPVAIVLTVLGLWMAVSARFPRQHQREGPQRQTPLEPRGRMSAAEARSILGVGETATPKEIQAAYTRLMKRAHPDHGGSAG